MRSTISRILPFIAMAEMFKSDIATEKGQSRRAKVAATRKCSLTKRQRKARAKNKRGRISRKINRINH
jgi:hypothetical protein